MQSTSAGFIVKLELEKNKMAKKGSVLQQSRESYNLWREAAPLLTQLPPNGLGKAVGGPSDTRDPEEAPVSVLAQSQML